MVKTNNPDLTGKGIGLILASSFLMEEAGKILKSDSSWYKYENKQLLNNLLIKNHDLIMKEKNLVNLLQNEEVLESTKKLINDNTLETEDILSALTVEKKIFINFIYLFLSGTDQSLQNLDILLEAMKNRLQLFTENDLFHVLKDFSKQTTITKYDDKYFSNFINNYK